MTDKEIILIYQYHQFLLGNQKALSLSSDSTDSYVIKKNALFLLRYAVEKILRWDAIKMKMYFNKDVVDRLKLHKIMSKINVPPEINPKEDWSYYAHILYPDKIKVDFKDLTEKAYKRVLEKKTQKIPRGFFDDAYGKDRAIYCLQYILKQNDYGNDIESLYARFINPNIDDELNSVRLSLAKRCHWTKAIDYLHEALPPDKKNNVFYHFYKMKLYLPLKKS